MLEINQCSILLGKCVRRLQIVYVCMGLGEGAKLQTVAQGLCPWIPLVDFGLQTLCVLPTLPPNLSSTHSRRSSVKVGEQDILPENLCMKN